MSWRQQVLVILRIVVLMVLIASAVISLVLMFNAGRSQKSILLIVMFTGWVLSPFLVLFTAALFSNRWSFRIRKVIYLLALLLSLSSLLAYSVGWTPPGTKTAFKWLMVPLASWVILLIVFTVVRRSLRKNDGAT